MRFLRRRSEEREARGRARYEELERRVPAAARILREMGAWAVFVFGSVANGETTADSDLDLATEGLPGRAYFGALAELMRRLPAIVDLVRLEEAPEPSASGSARKVARRESLARGAVLAFEPPSRAPLSAPNPFPRGGSRGHHRF